MKIDRKIVIQLDESEDDLFIDFLDFLEELTDKMANHKMDFCVETASIFNDLVNAQTLLDRAYTNILKMED